MSGIDLVVVTDRWGRFCFSVPSGKHTLSVLGQGFRPLYRPLGEVPANAELSLTLQRPQAAGERP